MNRTETIFGSAVMGLAEYYRCLMTLMDLPFYASDPFVILEDQP